MSPPSPETRGKFRAFYSDLRRETPLIVRAIRKCEKEILYLLKKNRLSVGAQHALARHWYETGQEHRFAFAGPVVTPDGKTAFVDLRPSTSELVLNRWPNPDWEQNVCVMQFSLVVTSKRVLTEERTAIGLTSLASASSHAFCRRVERGGGSMLDAARDLQNVRPWADVSASMGLLDFVAPTEHGFWRVEIIRVATEGIGPGFDAFARTWISGDDTYDSVVEDGVCRLRALGPESDQARDILRELSETHARQLLDRVDG